MNLIVCTFMLIPTWQLTNGHISVPLVARPNKDSR